VRGYSALLKQIDPAAIPGLPKDFSIWIEELDKAGHDLRDILDALTDVRDRLSI
jgi:hypothetical protein